MKVMVLPRDPNPYQGLLHDAARDEGVRTRYAGDLTASHTLNMLLLPLELMLFRLLGWRVLHVHWVYRFAMPGGGLLFRAMLRAARIAGVRVVWTAHNVLPHNRVFSDDSAMRRLLVDSSDLVVFHTPEAAHELERTIGSTPRRSTVIPHGPFGIEPERDEHAGGPVRLLFFGRIARYKGVDDLLRALARTVHVSRLCLTIAGECDDPALRAELEDLAAPLGDRVELRFGRVPDAALPRLLGAHDALVLPFRRVTTSGSALFGVGSGLAVVVPDVPAFDGMPVIRFTPGVDGLADCLTGLASTGRDKLLRAGAEARRRATGTTWQDVAAATRRGYDAVLERPAGSRHPLLARASALWNDSLVRNSLFLMANFAMVAGFGFVFFAIIARLYPPAEVGLVTTAMSSTLLVSSIAGLGLQYSVVRFLPGATPDEKSALLNSVMLISAVATLVVSAGFLLIPAASSELYALGGVGFAVAFVVSNLLNSLKAVSEGVYIAERSAGTVLGANVLTQVAKVSLPFAFLSLGAIGAYWAQAVGLGLALVFLAAHYARTHDHRYRAHVDLAAVQGIARFSSGTYMSNLVGGVPAMLLPLIVLNRFGAEQAAYWYTAMMVGTAVFQLPSSVGQSLLAEGSHNPREWRALALRSTRLMLVLMGPIIAGLLLLAPFVLQLIGDSYEAGALTPMRLLVLSGVLVSANYVAGTLLYLGKRVFTITAVNVINLSITLGLSLTVAQDTTDIALAWLAGEVVNVILFGVAAWGVLRDAEGRGAGDRPPEVVPA